MLRASFFEFSAATTAASDDEESGWLSEVGASLYGSMLAAITIPLLTHLKDDGTGSRKRSMWHRDHLSHQEDFDAIIHSISIHDAQRRHHRIICIFIVKSIVGAS